VWAATVRWFAARLWKLMIDRDFESVFVRNRGRKFGLAYRFGRLLEEYGGDVPNLGQVLYAAASWGRRALLLIWYSHFAQLADQFEPVDHWAQIALRAFPTARLDQTHRTTYTSSSILLRNHSLRNRLSQGSASLNAFGATPMPTISKRFDGDVVLDSDPKGPLAAWTLLRYFERMPGPLSRLSLSVSHPSPTRQKKMKTRKPPTI
jgi:hypothetical protein